MLKAAANRARQTVAGLCRDAVFASLEPPDTAQLNTILAEVIAIRTLLQSLIPKPAAPPNPYADVDLAKAEEEFKLRAELESIGPNNLKFKPLNLLADLRSSELAPLYEVWRTGGMAAVIAHKEGR
jgi:hypothetical protein